MGRGASLPGSVEHPSARARKATCGGPEPPSRRSRKNDFFGNHTESGRAGVSTSLNKKSVCAGRQVFGRTPPTPWENLSETKGCFGPL